MIEGRERVQMRPNLAIVYHVDGFGSRAGKGAYVREFALGWDEETNGEIAADDTLVLHLESERETLRLSDLGWNAGDLADSPARPVIAMPVFLRQRLEAIALFGPHKNGADIDPDDSNV